MSICRHKMLPRALALAFCLAALMVPLFHEPQVAAARVSIVSDHVHEKTMVPATKYLSSVATSDCAARYHYVCKCGEVLGSTYSYGAVVTSSIPVLVERYRSNPQGGIALAGSSQVSHWCSAAGDIAEAFGYPADKVYNFAIGGTSASAWMSDSYVAAIASKQPSVVVFNGINDIRSSSSADKGDNQERAEKLYGKVETAIEKLRTAIPGVQIVYVSGFKCPRDYLISSDADGYCNIWERVDLFNGMMQEYAEKSAYVTFVDIEQYYLKTVGEGENRQVLFYTSLDKLKMESSLEDVQSIVVERKAGVTFGLDLLNSDLWHASRASYQKIWTTVVGAAAVKASGFQSAGSQPSSSAAAGGHALKSVSIKVDGAVGIKLAGIKKGKKATWRTTNSNVVTVERTGNASCSIIGKKAGTCTVYTTVSGKRKSIKVKVSGKTLKAYKGATGKSVGKSLKISGAGSTAVLRVAFGHSDTHSVRVASSNTKVASVKFVGGWSDGERPLVITANRKGTAVIKISNTYNKQVISFKVKVGTGKKRISCSSTSFGASCGGGKIVNITVSGSASALTLRYSNPAAVSCLKRSDQVLVGGGTLSTLSLMGIDKRAGWVIAGVTGSDDSVVIRCTIK